MQADILLSESVLVLIIALFCFVSYKWTHALFKLSSHKGIFHFRNIYLYFGLAFLFRFIHILWTLAFERGHNPLTLLLTGYFSMMAVLSILSTLYIHKISINQIWLHIIALLVAIGMFFTHSVLAFIVLNCIVLGLALLSAVFTKKITTNRVTLFILIAFWILSSFVFYRNLVSLAIKIPVYAILVTIFFSIVSRVYWRVVRGTKKR